MLDLGRCRGHWDEFSRQYGQELEAKVEGFRWNLQTVEQVKAVVIVTFCVCVPT
jgi:uncharacterized protein YeaO (DUF488 family)